MGPMGYGWKAALAQDLTAMKLALGRIEAQNAQILGAQAASRMELKTDMAQLDDELAALQLEVTNETTVAASAETLLEGIPALIQTAVNNALAAGATPTQLASLTTLTQTLEANDTALAAAVAANTNAAPPGNPPPPVTTPAPAGP
jgi:hypothetical protein